MYIRPTANEGGAYPPPQSRPAPGLIQLTDEQAATLVEYNGFVTIKEMYKPAADGFYKPVYEVEPNLEAWEAWKAEQATNPEPKPTATIAKRVTDLESNTAELQEALNMILTVVTE